MSGAGTRTASNFSPATPEQLDHLYKTHLDIFIEKDTGEVYIAYSLGCEAKAACPLPRGAQMLASSSGSGGSVSFRICPTRPCGP